MTYNMRDLSTIHNVIVHEIVIFGYQKRCVNIYLRGCQSSICFLSQTHTQHINKTFSHKTI